MKRSLSLSSSIKRNSISKSNSLSRSPINRKLISESNSLSRSPSLGPLFESMDRRGPAAGSMTGEGTKEEGQEGSLLRFEPWRFEEGIWMLQEVQLAHPHSAYILSNHPDLLNHESDSDARSSVSSHCVALSLLGGSKPGELLGFFRRKHVTRATSPPEEILIRYQDQDQDQDQDRVQHRRCVFFLPRMSLSATRLNSWGLIS